MQLLTHAPIGPWPELGSCPCCGRPWGHDFYIPGPDPWPDPWDFPVPKDSELTPSPFEIEIEPQVEPEPPTLAVSGVGLEFLLLMQGSVLDRPASRSEAPGEAL